MHYAAAHDKKNDSHLMTFEYILGVLELAVVEATIDPYKYIQCANIISIMSSSRTSKSNTQAAKINSSNNNIQVAKINSNSNRQARQAAGNIPSNRQARQAWQVQKASKQRSHQRTHTKQQQQVNSTNL